MLDLQADQNSPQRVTGKVIITDIKMPFGSMVNFMVKATLAAIPAAIIVSIVVSVIFFILTTFFAGLGSNLRR